MTHLSLLPHDMWISERGYVQKLMFFFLPQEPVLPRRRPLVPHRPAKVAIGRGEGRRSTPGLLLLRQAGMKKEKGTGHSIAGQFYKSQTRLLRFVLNTVCFSHGSLNYYVGNLAVYRHGSFDPSTVCTYCVDRKYRK